MGDVRELFPTGPPYDGWTCECGETWFDMTVVLDKQRRVNGWQLNATCVSCHKPVQIEGWAHDDT